MKQFVQEDLIRLAGHCACYNEENASKVLLWDSQQGHPNRGRLRTTYIVSLKLTLMPLKLTMDWAIPIIITIIMIIIIITIIRII